MYKVSIEPPNAPEIPIDRVKKQTDYIMKLDELMKKSKSNMEEKVEVKRFCTNCGEKVKGEQKFCGACGSKL